MQPTQKLAHRFVQIRTIYDWLCVRRILCFIKFDETIMEEAINMHALQSFLRSFVHVWRFNLFDPAGTHMFVESQK